MKTEAPIAIILALAILMAACQSGATPAGDVRVTDITENELVTGQLTQTKSFDQCSSASSFKTEVQFSDSSSQTSEQQLVLGGKIGGTFDVPETAKVEISGSIEKRFSSSQTQGQAHFESASIEVPAHTRQEYTIVWQETRSTGTVEYVENGETKTIDYSYRVGLALESVTGKDIPCPSPSFQLTGCGTPEECSDVVRLQDLFPDGTDFTQKNTVFRTTIDPSQAFRLVNRWCAGTQALLEDNLKQVRFVFDVNGVSYLDQARLQYSSQIFKNHPDQPWHCYGGGVIFSKPAPGTYKIDFGIELLGTVFDGDETFGPGTDGILHFEVTVK